MSGHPFPEMPTPERRVLDEETRLHQRPRPEPFLSGLVGWTKDQENSASKQICLSVYEIRIISQQWTVQVQETPKIASGQKQPRSQHFL